VSAKSGENIAYIQSIKARERSAYTIAMTSIPNMIKNIIPKESLLAISITFLIFSSMVISL